MFRLDETSEQQASSTRSEKRSMTLVDNEIIFAVHHFWRERHPILIDYIIDIDLKDKDSSQERRSYIINFHRQYVKIFEDLAHFGFGRVDYRKNQFVTGSLEVNEALLERYELDHPASRYDTSEESNNESDPFDEEKSNEHASPTNNDEFDDANETSEQQASSTLLDEYEPDNPDRSNEHAIPTNYDEFDDTNESLSPTPKSPHHSESSQSLSYKQRRRPTPPSSTRQPLKRLRLLHKNGQKNNCKLCVAVMRRKGVDK